MQPGKTAQPDTRPAEKPAREGEDTDTSTED